MTPLAPPENFVQQLLEFRGPTGAYDEFRHQSGQIRPHWQRIVDAFQKSDGLNLVERWFSANKLLRESGVNLTGNDQEGVQLRPWQLDLIPIVYSADDWEMLRAGINQRARLIDAIINDIYGPCRILQEGWLPPQLVYYNQEFQRPFYQLPPQTSPFVLYGCELARSSSGRWWVMADRASAPAGLSFMLENRIVLSKTLPQFLHRCQIHRLAPFFVQLQETLKEIAPQRKTNPSIVILTAGPENAYYYEDVFLARYLGYTLVEADDLAVRKQQVWIKTLRGLASVDIIIRRSADHRLDPLEIGGAGHGIAGLLQMIREKKVAMVNGPETGLLDSPVYMPFLPLLCRQLLGEELKIPSIATWWCGQKDPLAYVLKHLPELVIKPAFAHSGGREIIVSELSETQQLRLREDILKEPAAYVAQEKIVRSTAPCWVDQKLKAGHLALRTFAVRADNQFEIVNGGLVRVQESAEPMQLSVSAGHFSKDVWICSDKPVPAVSLLGPMQAPPKLQRSTSKLPSRAADNLFWLGRYLERLEFSGRIIRKVTDRLISESANQPVDDVVPLVSCLAKQGIIEESFAIEDFLPKRNELETIWPHIVWNKKEVGPFQGLSLQVLRVAANVRDRMTEDFWRAVNLIGQPPRSTSASELGELGDLVNNFMLHVSAATGQITDGLVHGPTRLFLQIGRFLERAYQLLYIQSQYLQYEQGEEPLSLVTLLDVCNSVMTYRYRYRANFSALPAFDLLVTDSSNPHAMIFQFAELQRLIGDLPSKLKKPFISPELEQIRKIHHELESLIGSEEESLKWSQYRKDLVKLFGSLEPRLNTIHDLLSQRYFFHAEFTQQMGIDPLEGPAI